MPPDGALRHPRTALWWLSSAMLVVLALLTPTASVAQTGGSAQTVRGTVRSQAGEPVVGASVLVLNRSTGAVADADGRFEVRLDRGAYDLRFSAVGFATQVRRVSVESQDLTLEVTLSDDALSLGEAVVTAEKRETRLQRTPVAVSSLDAQKLRDARAWDITDLTALAPSLYVVEHGNSSGSNFFNIRGTLGFTAQQSVATYVDGVYQFDFYSAPINFNNVERIEVLRGPQGTLYGRNAFSGVVNIVTKAPTNTPGGYAEADLGTYDRVRLTAGGNAPLVADRVFANVSAQYNRAGGPYSNPTLGTDDFDGRESFNVNGTVRTLVGTDWQVDLNAKTERSDDRGAYAWVSSDSLARSAPYTVFGNWDNTERRANTNVSASVGYFGPSVNVRSVTAVIDYRGWYPGRYDFDFTAADLVSGNGDIRQNQLTQEFRVSSAATDDRVRWTVGSYLFTEDARQITNTFFGDDFAAVDPAAPYQTVTDGETTGRGAALFGQATVGLTPALDLTAGARYDAERREIVQAGDLVAGGVTTRLGDPQTDGETFRSFTPKLTASYKLTDRALVYASYARGFRVGGFNVGATDDGTRVYDPESSDNYEAALKSDWLQNRLRVNVTGFYLQQRDQQVTTSANGIDFVTLNVGDMNNLGLELEVTALPVRGLTAEWSAALSRARYDRLDLFDFGTGTVVDFAGNRPIYNPTFSSFAAVQVDRPLRLAGHTAAAFARVEQRYVGRYEFDFENTQSQDGYALFNVRTGLRAGAVEVALWGRNVTDAQYLTWGSFGSYMLGRPATWGLTVTGRL